MTTIPELCDRCNSWIIVDSGTPVIETWSRDYVETIASRNAPNVVIYTSLQWLQHFNTIIGERNNTPRFNIGDAVRFVQPSGGRVQRMSEDREYRVIEYDHNDKGWPDGCCGTPFVRVIADDGRPFYAYAYRFVPIA